MKDFSQFKILDGKKHIVLVSVKDEGYLMCGDTEQKCTFDIELTPMKAMALSAGLKAWADMQTLDKIQTVRYTNHRSGS